ncbi:MAG: LysM peptidoglycan-binding domain-containing protein [Fimbriimonadaceae bacterium]|nr:LysM peptidoglycan-binding domain-containing protein [Fimbriimonadaceae bacterium]
MKRYAPVWWAAAALLVSMSASLAATDRPVVRMPAVEQGSQVRGDTLVDVVMKPADDGTPLKRLEMLIDGEAVIVFDLQPAQRNATYNWGTGSWPDGRHEVVAKLTDLKDRVSEYRTFVYVWNQGRPTPASSAAEMVVQDADGALDNVITSKALLQVRVDPKLGAKWVILYLNDRMICMVNSPPYQTVLDVQQKRLADGPYVVYAKVIHPDNSETITPKVPFTVNLAGQNTTLRPAPAVPSPAGPSAPVPTVVGPAPSVPAVTGVDAPGPQRASDVGLSSAPPAPVGVARGGGGGRLIEPTAIEGGRVEVGGLPGSAPLLVPGAAPVGPAVSLPGKTGLAPSAAQRSLPHGPLQPAQVAGQPIPAAGGVGGESLSSPAGQVAPVAVGTPSAAPRRQVGQPLTASGASQAPGAATASAAGEPGQVSPSRATLSTPTGTRPVITLPTAPASAPRVTAPSTAPTPTTATSGPATTQPRTVGPQPPSVATPGRQMGPQPTAVQRPRPSVSVQPARSIGRVHVVKKGESLTAIARRYQANAKEVVAINGLTNPSLLRIGQKLIIPGGRLVVNGTPVKTDVAPLQQRSGVQTSPLRFVVEALGGSITYAAPEKRITATTADRGVITINVGSPTAQVNDENVLLDLAAYIRAGRTMVPTRFISQAFDVTIEVDPQSGNIVVRSNR